AARKRPRHRTANRASGEETPAPKFSVNAHYLRMARYPSGALGPFGYALSNPAAGHSLSSTSSLLIGVLEWLIVEGPTRQARNPVRARIAEFYFESLIDIVE